MMRTVLKALGLFIWLVLLAFLYGAIWNRYPEGYFPVPPEAVSNWIASRYLAEFNIEDKTDILVLLYSFFTSSLISFCVWGAWKFWKKVR
ncbi:hypothetical protein [Noviherbaspirillum malthae]|uniref:hypothetical protein n=1 Tax=Noviherbaspirillum malthae TaxID=1260987 RepID=UPI001E29266E|nr:hypothetical protein [Noviherbaspirillum malthae]